MSVNGHFEEMTQMKPTRGGLSKAVLATAVALVALLVVPSLAQAQGTKIPITGGTGVVFVGATALPYPYMTAAGSVTVGKTTPAQLTIPVGAFGMPFLYTAKFPLSNPYLYFSSRASGYAPVGSPGVFKAGPKPTRPANFNYCPGFVGNPGCVTANQGTKPGIVKYTATPGKQFGGTMKLFSAGTGQTVVYAGYSGPTLIHYKFTGSFTVAVGQSYAKNASFTLPSATVTYGAVIGTDRFIQTPGIYVSAFPGYSAQYTGFPFTTGQVAVQVLRAGTPASPNSTYTTTGSDGRTPLGKGNITMVAGGLGHYSYGLSLTERARVTLSLPEPGALLMLGCGVLGLAGLAALRRR
jgi:hypothetical protein